MRRNSSAVILVTLNLELYVPANYFHWDNFLLTVIWSLFFFLVGRNHSTSRTFVSWNMVMVLTFLVDQWNMRGSILKLCSILYAISHSFQANSNFHWYCWIYGWGIKLINEATKQVFFVWTVTYSHASEPQKTQFSRPLVAETWLSKLAVFLHQIDPWHWWMWNMCN